MRTVDIATYCEWNSYGSILQAWALRYCLVSMGCEVKHLRLNTLSSEKPNLFFKGRSVKNLLINTDRFLHQRDIFRRFDLTMGFLNQNFDFLVYPDYAHLKACPPKADIYIAGSDQIWNPHSMNPFFYLDFVKDPQKKMSYAASMGVSDVPERYKSAWHDAVGTFGHISVREQEVKELIEAERHQEVAVHIDPTFLVDREVWRTISKPYAINTPYILVYALYWDKKYNNQLRQLHKRTGLPVIAICGQLQQVYAQKRIYDASVQEFLWLFDHAEYIVTSSFHGLAFSVIFEKKFSVVINPKKPSRLRAVLNSLGIENEDIYRLYEHPGPDYEKIRTILCKERERANEYLSKGIDVQ